MYEKKPWLKYFGNTPHTIDYPDVSLYALVKKDLEKYPNNDALIFFGEKTSRADLLKKIDHMSRKFAQIGIKKGDMVIICLPNMSQAIISIYALNRLGAIPAPIHPLSVAPEIYNYAKIIGATAAITLDGFFSSFTNIMESAGIKRVIVCSLKTEMDILTKIGYSIGPGRKIKPIKYNDKIFNWTKLEAEKDTPEIEKPNPLEANDLALILFTGGSTSRPKAVMLSNMNFNALALQVNAAGGPMVEGGKVLSILPVFHGFGLAVCFHAFLINNGVCIIVPRFKAKFVAGLVKKHKPNYMAGVPLLFDLLSTDKKFCKVNLDSFKGVFSGGDSLSPEVKKRFDAVLKKGGSDAVLREGLGLTETVTAVTIAPPHEYREKTVGIPCPDNLLKIVKMGTEEECPPMEDGEICVSSPTVMLGYYNDKKATDEVVKKHKDGLLWLHTGDIGCMDEDGFFYFKQRLKRIIKTSGIAVFPSRIEDVLDKHPVVRLSCVIGIPHETKGEIPKAFILLKDKKQAIASAGGSEELKQKIIEYCKEQMLHYSCPKTIEFVDEMPKTRIGKIAYREFEEMEKRKRNNE